MDQGKSSLSSIVQSILLASGKLASDVCELACLEAELAKQNLLFIAFLTFLFVIMLMAGWLCVLTLSVLYLKSLHYSWLQALSYVTLLNSLLLLLTGLLVIKMKENLLFKATRRQLKQLKPRKGE